MCLLENTLKSLQADEPGDFFCPNAASILGMEIAILFRY
jgi:hypothetical protein